MCFSCSCHCTDERGEEEKKAEETELFTKYYTEWKGGNDKDQSYKNIPRFYYRVLLEYMTFINPMKVVVLRVIWIVL